MDKKKGIDLTLPLGDTLPGPASVKVAVIFSDDIDDIPSVETDESIDELGHGTANDIASSSQTK